jgi:hypothetical protein
VPDWRRLRRGRDETPDLEALLADIGSDAFQYLDDAATTRDRCRQLIDRLREVQANLERAGRWEEFYEWRIATDGTDRLEKLATDRYRAWSDHHGIFTAEFKTFAEAFEALTVLSEIQKDLFYAVGWSSWVDWGQMNPDDPPAERGEEDEELTYLRRLSSEARARARELQPEVAIELDRVGRWTAEASAGRPRVSRAVIRGDDGFAVESSSRTLSLSTEAPTLGRALEFLGIYEQLPADLEHHLHWAWR